MKVQLAMTPDQEEKDFTRWNQNGVGKEKREDFDYLAMEHHNADDALDYDRCNPECHRDYVRSLHGCLAD
jgi:hypothetical protein